MEQKYNEAFTMLCTASYFLKQSTAFKMPEGMNAKAAQIVEQIEELKTNLQEAD